MRNYKTLAIILSRTNYGEAGRIYNLLTPEGRLSAMAKGVRKPGSKLGPHLDLFAQIELVLVSGKGLETIIGARLIKAYTELTTDLDRAKTGFLLCEMTNKLTSGRASTELFSLLAGSLDNLNEGLSPLLVELDFKLKLLEQLGYRPNLEQSIKSHQTVTKDHKYAFSYEGGGLVEKTLAAASAPAISEDEIKLWRLLLKHPLTEALRVKNLQPIAAKSLPIINDFYAYTFDKRFKSLEM